MQFDDYRHHDAVSLADLVRSGDVRPRELLDAAAARADAVNPTLGAICRPMLGVARRRCTERLTGTFAGVPFLIKDLMQEYAGQPSGSGTRALQKIPSAEHSAVVQRWLDAGLVIFGQTNTPEFGLKGVTEPKTGGSTRNPWDLSRTPGGSSGGSAAAVAAGVVPVAGANDGGGSIRIPAALCGLFGLKPGRALVADGPLYDEYMQGASVNGVISRSVRDSAAMLDIMSRPSDPRRSFAVAVPETPFVELAEQTPRKLRIGFCVDSPLGTPVDPDAAAAVADIAELLTSLGHHVEPATPNIDGPQLADDFLTLFTTYAAASIARVRSLTGAPATAFETDTQVLAAVGRTTSAAEYYETLDRRGVYGRALVDFHNTYDLYLTPTTARHAWKIGEFDTPPSLNASVKALLRLGQVDRVAMTSLWRTRAIESLSAVPFTQLANLTGRPAMTVPTYWTASGLPLGVQFVGATGSEGLLLALATQIEQARPWANKTPPM